MTRNTWSEGLQERVARAVRSARGNRSAQELADETARLGYPVSRSQIANLESGRKRGLDIAELMILAAALRVPPVALLFPDLPDGEVEVLPGRFVSSVFALLRFTGERDLEPKSGLGRLAKLSRERFDKQVRHSAALDFLERLAVDKPDEFTADQVLSLTDSADQIRELDRLMAAIPGAVVAGEGAE